MREKSLQLSLYLAIATCGCSPSTGSSALPRASQAAVASAPADVSTILLGVNVVHAERERAREIEPGVNIVIRRGRIVAITKDPPPAGARVENWRGKWVAPAYIDAHVHFFQSSTPYTRPDVMDLTDSVAYATDEDAQRKRIPQIFASYLRSGVTTVVDLGGPKWTFDVRTEARHAVAPRVYAAGPLISTKAFPALELGGDPAMLFAKSPQEATADAEDLVNNFQADLLKVLESTSVHDLEYTSQITTAVAQVARAHHLPLAVHSEKLALAKVALRAGSNLLAHSVFQEPVDDEFLTLVRAKRPFCTPTLYALAGYGQVMEGTWRPTSEELRFAPADILAALTKPAPVPAATKQWAEDTHFEQPPAAAMENLQKMRDAGMRIVLGTDAGNVGNIHGPSVFREMRLMAKAGMTPKEILVAATVDAANLLGQEAELGTVDVGKRADLVVLEANPLESVENFSGIHAVLKGGLVVVRENELTQ